VKVRTLCILCNNWCLFVLIDLMPELTWCPFKHSLVKFPCPNKIDRFVHNDGDRESKLLSLSLRYYIWIGLTSCNDKHLKYITTFTVLFKEEYFFETIPSKKFVLKNTKLLTNPLMLPILIKLLYSYDLNWIITLQKRNVTLRIRFL